ncbi:MAG: methyltransferase domain-containing protein [Bryobacteraceae bacterium]
MEARNPIDTQDTRKLIEDLNRLGWYHSIQLPSGEVIEGIQTLQQLRHRIAQFPIPQDLTGKRVLDIGAWDGWFSFEMERRGARVLAIDNAKRTRFLKAREILGSQVDYQIADICRVTARDLGRFDIVLFFGVLYHLKHPMRALETVCDLSTDLALVESFVIDDGSQPNAPPVMEFYETTELLGQFDNWVGPNTSCLLAMCRTAGFARVELRSVIANRAHAMCYRKWPSVVSAAPPPGLICVENSVSRDHNFSAAGDDYLSFWVRSAECELTAGNVFPEIGGYGVRPAEVHPSSDEGWLVSCKLPPGLNPGWHNARVRVRDSAFSNPVRMAVDLPVVERRQPHGPRAQGLRIHSVTDGRTFEESRVHAGDDACMSMWAAGLPEPAAPERVTLRLDGTDLPATWVSAADANGLRQINALLPPGIQPGQVKVALALDGAETATVDVELMGQ